MNGKITNIKYLRLNKVNKILIVEYKSFYNDVEILDKAAQFLDSGFNLVEFYPECDNDCKNLEITQKLRQLTSIYDSMFLIKNRLDIAQITDSDGVILDINSIKPIYAKKLLKEDKIIGFDSNLLLSTEIENYILKERNFFDFIQGKIEIEYINGVKIFNNSIIERLK